MTDATVTVTIETDDAHDDLTVPVQLLDVLREGEETDPEVVGDVAMLDLAHRIHGAVHHEEGDVDEELVAVEEVTMECFEDRFERSFGEVTGHSH